MATASAEIINDEFNELPYTPPADENVTERAGVNLAEAFSGAVERDFDLTLVGVEKNGSVQLPVLDSSTVAKINMDEMAPGEVQKTLHVMRVSRQLLPETVTVHETDVFSQFMQDFTIPLYRLVRGTHGRSRSTIEQRCQEVQLYLAGGTNDEASVLAGQTSHSYDSTLIKNFASIVQRYYSREQFASAFTEYQQGNGCPDIENIMKAGRERKLGRLATKQTAKVSGGLRSRGASELKLLAAVGMMERRNTPWQTRAECKKVDPELFFPKRGGSTKRAKEVCGACEVREMCLTEALENNIRFGIWGGLTERERNKLKK